MIELPFPAKILWPNGRGHWAEHARQVKKHRAWAKLATSVTSERPASITQLVFTIYPMPRGPAPDADNSIAAVKSYIDGICDAYGTDDRHLPVPRIQFAERVPHGKIVVTIL